MPGPFLFSVPPGPPVRRRLAWRTTARRRRAAWLLAGLAGMPGVQAGEPLPAAWLQAAEAHVRQAVAQGPWAGARLQVDIGPADPRLNLAPCQQVQPYLPAGLPAGGRTRVGLRCLQGPKAWNISLPLTLRAWGPAWLAQGPLPVGAVLDTQHFKAGEADLAAIGQVVQSLDAAAGRVLVRPLGAGDALRQTDLKARVWFAAGDTVRLVANGPGWRVVSEGVALSAGLEGQTTPVRTENGRTVQGRAVAPREVQVMP